MNKMEFRYIIGITTKESLKIIENSPGGDLILQGSLQKKKNSNNWPKNMLEINITYPHSNY